MVLVEFQRTLLDLYTDRVLLDEFLADPTTSLARRDLSERERTAILGLPRDLLDRTQKELVAKRYNLAGKILASSNGLVVLAFGRSGRPELAWGHPRMYTLPISADAFWLLRSLALAQARFTPQALLHASTETEHLSLRTMFELAKLLYARRLAGKFVYVPGVTH